ncbi:hypothetical protein NDU88_008631 [Pleurodeles waltl]|uniref:Uncharacterized protein n=1 Tax=Pleurodeles waltl TaxID=8319 RepID=A0AAV7PSP0_PLEWA|nr:hypothetical protein NDU88_008631 [Pleurodeles waltl]
MHDTCSIPRRPVPRVHVEETARPVRSCKPGPGRLEAQRGHKSARRRRPRGPKHSAHVTDTKKRQRFDF